MPLAEANHVNLIPTILSRMPLAEANHVDHIPAILSRMPLAEVNLGNTLGFIYIAHCRYTTSGDGSRFFCLFNKKGFFSLIRGNKDFIGVAI